jgi:tetratricopeptide (TPR) repeat protein
MHNDTANNLGLVLATGFDAYQDWDDPSKDVLIKAYLLSSSALHDLDLGEFHIALTRTQECLKIQLSSLNPDHEQILNTYNNLGIAHGSLAEYDCGLKFLGKAEVILKNTPGRNPAKSVLLNVNMGRNYYCMGRFNEAEARLEAAMADSLEMDSWYWRVM